MNRKGAIIIIEDDPDDQLLMKEVFKELNYPNEICFFADGEKALAHLNNEPIEPFIILSDINMPKINGLELRAQIHENEQLRLKCTPYLFFSTSAEQKHVVEAYSKSIQGFFVKPHSIEHLTRVMRLIIDYWLECVSPDYDGGQSSEVAA